MTHTIETGKELQVFYDQDHAGILFQEHFNIIRHGDHFKTAILEFIAYDEKPKIFYPSDLYDLDSLTEKQARLAVIQYMDHLYTPKEVIQLRIDMYNTWREYLDDLIDELNFDDIIGDHGPDIPMIYNIDYVSGYSQGDNIYVIYDPSIQWIKSDTFKQLLFDCPVIARLDIYKDGEHAEEYYLEELLTDTYNYDRDEILEQAKTKIPEHYDFLSKHLPEYPEYI